MPIETAPKDVTILLYGAKRLEMCVGMHHSRDGWVTDTTSEWMSMYPPTHWMPLPAAPDHLRDVAEKVAPAAPDGWVMVPRKELGDGISLLHQAMVGACDCLTKTHEAKYHAESCFYRRLSEQCDKLEATIAASPAAPVVREQQHTETSRLLANVADAARRLVEHADFQLGGILSADSKAMDMPSKAVSQVKARHLASLRDRVAELDAALGITGGSHAK